LQVGNSDRESSHHYLRTGLRNRHQWSSTWGPLQIDAVIDVAEVVVTNDKATNRSLREIGILQNCGCFLARITRSQIELPLTPDTRLRKGDVMIVTGERSLLDQPIADLGTEEPKVTETDLVTFGAGIVLGLFLGQITIKLGDVSTLASAMPAGY
jgi:putative transport protein